MALLRHWQPTYWFAGHMHVKFAAVVPHGGDESGVTRFLALDKVRFRVSFTFDCFILIL
jgi:lariat debranching enzyme